MAACHRLPAPEAAPPSRRRKWGKPWRDYSAGQRAALCLLAAAEVGLAAAAWRDLAHRDPSQVRGRKSVWALVIAVNIVGPLAYFRWGRLSAFGAAPAHGVTAGNERRRAS